MTEKNEHPIESLSFRTVISPVRSIIHIGDFQIHNSKRWCWLHRKMMVLCFGWHVENKDEEKATLND